MAVDVTALNTKSAELALGAINYKALTDLKTAITGASSGALVVNTESLSVDGADFTTLLNAEITSIDSSISSLNTSLDTLADEIIVILAG